MLRPKQLTDLWRDPEWFQSDSVRYLSSWAFTMGLPFVCVRD